MRLTLPVLSPRVWISMRGASWCKPRKRGIPVDANVVRILASGCTAAVDPTELAKAGTPVQHDESCLKLLSKSPYIHSSAFLHQSPGSHWHPRFNDDRLPGRTMMYNFATALPMAKRQYSVLKPSPILEEKESEKASEEDSKKSQEKQVRAMKITLIAFGGIFAGTALYIFFTYGSPQLDQNGNPMRDEFTELPYFQQYSKRAMAEIRGMMTMVTNPSREKLLPDPVKPPYHQPPYTLLIELTGVLVHPDWTYKTGWRFKKRPGVDYFLNQLSGYFFEVVIYTSELGFTAFPIIDALDTQNVVHYRLFRDSTRYDNSVHVKDLEKINRDLTKVIAIDWNEKAIHEHRNNAIVLPRWKGNDDDRTLFDLAALLQTIGTSGIEDVRGVLEYYSKFEDPIAEFRKKQQELALKEKNSNLDKIPAPTFSPNSGWLGSLFRKT